MNHQDCIDPDCQKCWPAGSNDPKPGQPGRKPYKPDLIRVERGDWIRASGMCLCDVCGVSYFDHSPVTGYEWLMRLCDGRMVKT